ncbi:hypothetical protein D3C84_1006400 [compost metagenome]
MLGNRGQQNAWVQAGEPGAAFQHLRHQGMYIGAKDKVQVRSFGALGQIDRKLGGEDAFDVAVVTTPAIAAQPGRRQ